jgi:hypothetical protein
LFGSPVPLQLEQIHVVTPPRFCQSPMSDRTNPKRTTNPGPLLNHICGRGEVKISQSSAPEIATPTLQIHTGDTVRVQPRPEQRWQGIVRDFPSIHASYYICRQLVVLSSSCREPFRLTSAFRKRILVAWRPAQQNERFRQSDCTPGSQSQRVFTRKARSHFRLRAGGARPRST